MNSHLATYGNRFAKLIYNESDSGLSGLTILALRLAILLGMFILLDQWLLSVTQLPVASYFEPIITLEFLRELGLVNYALAGILLLALTMRGQLWRGWSHDMQPVRVLVVLVCLLLAWWFTTYDYNLYFNQGHFLDRGLIIGFALLVMWKPVFVFPFLLILLPILWQFNHPMIGYSITQVILPLNLLKLFLVAFIANSLTGYRKYNDFLFLTICLLGASYLGPGLGKLQLGWTSYPHLDLLIISSYAVGWLGFLSPEQISTLAAESAHFNWLLIAFTIVAECGVFLALWNRRTMLLWLAAWVSLHVGILLTSGILFWTWIAIDLCIFFLLLTRGHLPNFQIFNRKRFILAPAIMLIGIVVFRPTNLSWYDVPVSYTYQMAAHTNDDQWSTLPTNFFGHYETLFALNSFGYLADSPQLGIVWGATRDQAIADTLLAAKTPDEIWAIEAELGTNEFDDSETRHFEDFISQYVYNFNQRQSTLTPFSLLPAPRQVWTFGNNDMLVKQTVIDKVRVYQVTSFFDGREYRELRRELVREIAIPV